MKKPLEHEYTSHVAYTRDLEKYCHELEIVNNIQTNSIETLIQKTESLKEALQVQFLLKKVGSVKKESVCLP